MTNITEIKEKLDTIYKEYKNNKKNKLSNTKINEVSKLLADMTFSKESVAADIAAQLSRFPAEVTNVYFDTLTRAGNISIETIDDILKEFLSSDKDPSRSQFFVSKFVFAVSSIMKNYEEKSLQSVKLPELVVFISHFAVKSDKNRDQFRKLIDNTMGEIYKLDYSNMKKDSLSDIWNVTDTFSPELSKSGYGELINDWAKKYGFMSSAGNTGETDSRKDTIAAEKTLIKSDCADASNSDKTINKTTSGNSENIKKEAVEPMTKEFLKETIISAIGEAITPLSTAIDLFHVEFDKIHELSAVNAHLNLKNSELEQQIKELNQCIQEKDSYIKEIEAERDDLEIKNAEIDNKLKDAYSINSREESLEAQKVRADLTKSFTGLYEDWLEYETSDVNEENYESLQAIIKKIFRALKRNGIDFEENN